MKRKLISILVVFAAIITISCEKVILIELNEADQKVVVEAIVSNDTAQNFVILSKSGGFYQSNNFSAISDAVITITESGGTSYILAESPAGYYSNPSLVGQLNTNYSLEIVMPDQTITASTFLPDTTSMDSLTYEYNNGQFGSDGYTLFINFTDKVNQENYYRFKISADSSQKNDIILLDDLLINGKSTTYPLFQIELMENELIECEFIGMDKATYDYFTTLIEVVGGSGATSAAPGNPPNNLSGDVLGFFGGYAITYSSVTIVP